MNQSGSQTLHGGNPSKVIQDRIALVEHHFGEICDGVGGYARALGKLRNKGDQIAKALRDYAQNETHNATTQAALREFVNHLSVIEDYRNTEVQRIEAKVISPLTAYGKSCKQSKERIKIAFTAHEKEMRQKRTLDRLMERSPHDSRQIAQTELQKAALEATKAQQDVEQEMDSFEKKKLKDIKQVMTEFVTIQLAFHSKALEYFSQSYQSLTGVHEEDDLEEFHNSLRPMMIQTRQDAQRQMNVTKALPDKSSRGVASNFVANSNGVKQQQPKQERGTRNNTLNSTNPSSLYSQTTQDDDDDDDDDEDELTDEDDDDDDDDDDDTELPSHRGNQNQIQSKPHVAPPRR